MHVELGQFSAAGRKPYNQDCHGALIPDGQVLRLKGIAVALADGISSSPVSQIAAETAVKSFLDDYYCTSDAWTAKIAASRVIEATNSWLYSRTRQASSPDLGYVCTFSALVLKARQAHLFHVGDSRIWRVAGSSLEQLTRDHRVQVSADESYLGRALGMAPAIEIDHVAAELRADDVFVLTTDGVHDFVSPNDIVKEISASDTLESAAASIVGKALEAGSTDNLTIQIVRIADLADEDAAFALTHDEGLPPAPIPRVPGTYEGYELLRGLHATNRSYIFLGQNTRTGAMAALKFPSMDLRDDADYLRRLAMEEWVAKRIASPHVLKPDEPPQDKHTLFVATEYVEGQTLRQWMTDNPHPSLETVRGLIEQIAKGMRAFHRAQMLHQDIRPENIMIDKTGTVKIIDFGSVAIAGVLEAAPSLDTTDILGTHQYTAPEVFLGYPASPQSDLFSLGVIAYEMLTGRLPYGDAAARVRSTKAQRALRYRRAGVIIEGIPDWVDGAIARAVHPEPHKRYDALSEFLEDLRRPNRAYGPGSLTPLAERDPVRFWQAIAALLAAICGALLFQLFGHP
ncbi:MAG: bifunctional protein-serine/threonine kinase/phosphatase [Pseudomonadota bacterium]